MSFWEKFRELSYDSRFFIWLSVGSLWLFAFLFGLIDHDWYITVMWIASVPYLIWAIWASVPPKDPPKK